MNNNFLYKTIRIPKELTKNSNIINTDGKIFSLYDTIQINKDSTGKKIIISPTSERIAYVRQTYKNASLEELEKAIKIHHKFSEVEELKKMYNEKLMMTK